MRLQIPVQESTVEGTMQGTASVWHLQGALLAPLLVREVSKLPKPGKEIK